MHEVVAVGVDVSDPMVLDYGKTHTSTDEVAHVIKNEGMKVITTNISGNAIEFELDDSFLGGYGGINDGFHNWADHNTHTLIDEAAHVNKNEGMKVTDTNIGGNAIEFELDDSFHDDYSRINDGFHNRADHNFYKYLGVSWDLKGCEDTEFALWKLSLSSISTSWECDHMTRDMVFDRKKGHNTKIFWCSFTDLVNDGFHLLKL